MDQRQKSALRKNHITLADQLILDEDFFAQLRQSKIFSEGMISIIKTENKPRNQVYKMLELLEKRGPHAFENFVGILRDNFWWVADKLEESYQERLEARAQSDRKGCQPVQQSYASATKTVYQRRAVSTPPRPRPQRAVPFPVQISSSTSHYPVLTKEDRSISISGRQNNWELPSPDDYSSADEVDGPHNEIPVEVKCEGTVAPIKDDSEEKQYQEKNYVDKSLSPIHILESRPTKEYSHAVCSPIPAPDEDNNEVEEGNKNSEIDQIIDESAKDDDNDIKQEDETDGSENIANLNNDDLKEGLNDNFESSEIYYDRVRTQSEFDLEDNAFYTEEIERADEVAADGGEDEEYRILSRQSSLDSRDMDKEDEEIKVIREIYLKIKWLSDQENRYDSNEQLDLDIPTEVDDTGITFKMITDTIDDLIYKRCNNELQKMYNSCYKFFDDKDKKLPLFTCIEKLRDAKNELNTRLLDEMRKTNEMANDMYMHSQDMKNLDKLKTRLNKLEHENDDFRTNCETLENVKAEQMRRIMDLEKLIVNMGEVRKEEKKVAQRGRPGISPKRSQISQSMTPRKPPFSDPRMAIMQTGYQSTKSPRTQASASAWRPYNKK